MTYIPRDEVTQRIPNKYEAIRVLALECRRLNDILRAREETTDRKITTMAVERLLQDKIHYYDARERREQERSEAMLSAAEDMLDAPLDLEADLEDEVAEEAAGTAEASPEAKDSAGAAPGPEAPADAAMESPADAETDESEAAKAEE